MQAWVGVGVARKAQAQKLELRVLRHHAHVATGVHRQALRAADVVDGAVDALAVEALTHLQDRGGGVAHHFPTQLGHRVFRRYLGVGHGYRAGEAAGQSQLEVRQAFAAQRAAKTNHRGLADPRGSRNVGNRVIQDLPRVGQHVLGHLALCTAELLQATPNLRQHRHGAFAAPGLQVGVQDGRCAQEGGLCRLDDIGGDLAHIVAVTAAVFKAGSKRGAFEVRPQARHDAPADVDAAKSTQRERQIGRCRAQDAAERVHGLLTQCIGAGQGLLGDVRSRQGFGRA